jgi:hypothetical protein
MVPINQAASVARAPARGDVPTNAGARSFGSARAARHIDTSSVAGLRDRALIGLMVYSFARIGAALGWWSRMCLRRAAGYGCGYARRETSGTRSRATTTSRNIFQPYLDGAGLRRDSKSPLFRTIGRGTGRFTRTVLPQANVFAMDRPPRSRRLHRDQARQPQFPATGITAYPKNGGTLEKAAAIANHASTRTTQLYDRRRDELSLDEVERIVI